MASSLKMRWQNTTPSFSFRDRCEGRASLDYFKRGCFHHHVGQPDTLSSVLGFILVLYLMFFQQTAGIHIQMLGEPVYRHIRMDRLGQFDGTTFPFMVLVEYDLCHGFQYRVWRLLAHSPYGQSSKSGSPDPCSDIASDLVGLCSPPPR